MKAITLHPEWAHAVAYLGKRCENRDWKPPASLIGQRIAIHAGKSIGGRPGLPSTLAGLERLRWACPRMIDADLWGNHDLFVRRLGEPHWRLVQVSAIVATAIIGEPIESATAPTSVLYDLGSWADLRSRYWWPLLDVQAVDPVPCRGAQGFWEVPDHLTISESR